MPSGPLPYRCQWQGSTVRCNISIMHIATAPPSAFTPLVIPLPLDWRSRAFTATLRPACSPIRLPATTPPPFGPVGGGPVTTAPGGGTGGGSGGGSGHGCGGSAGPGAGGAPPGAAATAPPSDPSPAPAVGADPSTPPSTTTSPKAAATLAGFRSGGSFVAAIPGTCLAGLLGYLASRRRAASAGIAERASSHRSNPAPLWTRRRAVMAVFRILHRQSTGAGARPADAEADQTQPAQRCRRVVHGQQHGMPPGRPH